MARIILDDNDNDEAGTVEDDFIDGRGGDDILQGNLGADTVKGGDGDDSLFAVRVSVDFQESDPNELFGQAGLDGLRGSDGDDLLSGGTGDDVLQAEGGDNRLLGGDGDDVMTAVGDDGIGDAVGDNTLNGGAGDDDMVAGSGVDTFIGGAGADTFRFAALFLGRLRYDSGVGSGNRDRIVDFDTGEGDEIDLRSIGDDLAFVGEQAAPGVNELGFIETGGATILRGNTSDGTADVDFEIQLRGTGLGLSTDDFVF
jgi:Ca2+-binding RTX toxin-like protein